MPIAVEGASVGVLVIFAYHVIIRQRQVGVQYGVHILCPIGTFRSLAERRPVGLASDDVEVGGGLVIRLREVAVGDGEVFTVAHTCPGARAGVLRLYL